jgi:tRNA (cytidine/uridine-2'-O-)-methyltransferase
MKRKLNIVLYSPEIPQNTGNISRTCSVTGTALHIIKPIGFEISDKTLKRAGLDYWSTLEVYYYESYEEFAEKHKDDTIYYFSAHANNKYTDPEYEGNVYLMFGKETAGLPSELIAANPETSVRIPMLENRRCLNLSNAAAIAVYEVLRQWDFEGMLTGSDGRKNPF